MSATAFQRTAAANVDRGDGKKGEGSSEKNDIAHNERSSGKLRSKP